MGYCSSCGHSVAFGDNYCSNCGHQLNSYAGLSYKPYKPYRPPKFDFSSLSLTTTKRKCPNCNGEGKVSDASRTVGWAVFGLLTLGIGAVAMDPDVICSKCDGKGEIEE